MTAPLPTASRWNTYSRSRYPRLWDRCVGAWCPSLGVTGTRLFDASPYANWGTITNASSSTVWSVNNGGYCLDLDGTDDRVDCSTLASRINPLTRGSISLWVRFDTVASSQCLFGISDSADANGWVLFYFNSSDVANRRMYFGVYENNSYITNMPFAGCPDPVIGEWNHYCVTQDGTNAVMTFRGVRYNLLVASGSWFSGVSGANDVSWGDYVTSSGRGLRLNGQIDDMRLYDRVLNSEEIRLLATRRAIAYEPAYRPAYYMESDAGGGVAKPVLFHSYYMSQGMRP
jgi:hypothetical protein